MWAERQIIVVNDLRVTIFRTCTLRYDVANFIVLLWFRFGRSHVHRLHCIGLLAEDLSTRDFPHRYFRFDGLPRGIRARGLTSGSNRSNAESAKPNDENLVPAFHKHRAD